MIMTGRLSSNQGVRIAAKENPFRSEKLHQLHYLCPESEWQALHAKLAHNGYRGAIIGPHGNGKTTLLRRLHRELGDAGRRVLHVQLTQEARRFPPEVMRQLRTGELSATIILLDGAEQLSWLRRQSLKWSTRRHAAGFVITAHRSGLLPTVFTCRSSPALLRALLVQLLPERDFDCRALAEHYWQRHGGDLRAAWWEMYTRYPAL